MIEHEGRPEKKGPELTEREKKLFEITPEGRVLKCLRENSLYRIRELAKEIGTSPYSVALAIKRLAQGGVIKLEKKTGTGFVTKIQADPDKLKGILEKTAHYKINALIEKKPEMPITKIRDTLNLDYNTLKKIINDLEKAGLKSVARKCYLEK